MAEGSGLLNRRVQQWAPRVRIPPSPPVLLAEAQASASFFIGMERLGEGEIVLDIGNGGE